MSDPDAPITVMCPRHPTVSTGLRCSHCGTPICPKCMVQAPVGIRCPDCARPSGGLSAHPSLGMYLKAGAAGLGTAIAAGALATMVPLGFGFFGFIVAFLIGYAVGDIISRVSRRLPYRELAVLAFICASVGPILGRAIVVALMFPVPSLAAKAQLALTVALSLGPFELLAAAFAGIIAAGRVSR
jgi:hypothetical protein